MAKAGSPDCITFTKGFNLSVYGRRKQLFRNKDILRPRPEPLPCSFEYGFLYGPEPEEIFKTICRLGMRMERLPFGFTADHFKHWAPVYRAHDFEIGANGGCMRLKSNQREGLFCRD